MKRFWLIALLLLGCNIQLRAENSLVVLQYHHFSAETPVSTSVTPDQFDNQLQVLDQEGFTIWPLEEAIVRLREGRELPDKSLAITMDDAYQSVYTVAYPQLSKRNWPFTVFVSTETIDQGHSVYMSWAQMKEMVQHGVTFASHGHSHPYFVREQLKRSPEQWRAWVKQEIRISRQRLKTELGSDSKLFAYPYGEYDPDLENIVEETGLTGFGQQSGVIWSGSDFQALPRFPVSGTYAGIRDFSIKVLALPLPVLATEPRNPVLSVDTDKPILRLELAEGGYQPDLISCYATDQGKINIHWIDRAKLILEVIPLKPVPWGRSKYNCTAPQAGTGRFYWFSRQWLRLKRQ